MDGHGTMDRSGPEPALRQVRNHDPGEALQSSRTRRIIGARHSHRYSATTMVAPSLRPDAVKAK